MKEKKNLHGFPWNSMSQTQTEFHGVAWNCMGLFYTGTRPDAAFDTSLGETESGADLGGSSNSNENFEDRNLEKGSM